MKKITISSSLRFKDLIKETIRNCREAGINAQFPNIDHPVPGTKLTLEQMRTIEKDHFDAIRASSALYVINPQGYIGRLVTVEIGFALGLGLPVYFSEPADSIDLDALVTAIIPLDRVEDFLEL